MLRDITPVLLTCNEAPNIARTLSRLTWAKDIVVVDSGSTDETHSILAKYPQVRVFSRAFDTHASQWRYAIGETGILTDWVLRLDADYVLSETLITDLASLDSNAPVNGYRIGFDYAIYSNKLLTSLYPPNTILFRKDCISVKDDGHTESWVVRGPVAVLKSRIVHDDWKSVEHWVNAQAQYMRRELPQLRAKNSGVLRWLRLTPPLMPLMTFFYCLFAKGLILNGKPGIFYALQRTVAEAILSLMVIEQSLHDSKKKPRSFKISSN
jgi:glycosyltransferase involved in cell wall biosynthesis